MSEVASDVFEDLSMRHRRNSALPNQRILRIAVVVAIVFVLALGISINSGRIAAADRYAAVSSSKHAASKHCDEALGRHHYLMGPVVVGREMCVSHAADEPQVEVAETDRFRFLIVGDWGRDGMCCQRDVAAEMDVAVGKVKAQFVVSTGDNFYDDGIATSTDTQVDRSWRDVYMRTYAHLGKLSWKVILGNHDHRGNVRAQKALHRDEKMWSMPDQYYFETAMDGDVFMAFLDTSVLYYKESEWDEFQGDSFVMSYRDNQIAAFKNALSATKAKWKIVFGHHPLFSSSDNAVDEADNLAQMRTILMHILRDNHVAAYFSGHEHTLEHLQSSGVDFFISGAGSKISPLRMNRNESVFALDRQGFMVASFSEAMDSLNVKVVDLSGKVVHTASVARPEG